MKEKISGNVVEVRRKSNRVMVIVLALGKEMQKEKDCWSSVMKESCAWQTGGFIRQTNGKPFIVPVDVKQKLIVCLWEKNTEST